MANTFTPLHDRVVVRRIEGEHSESTINGIIIPETAREKISQGEVIAVGKGKSNEDGKVFPLDVKVGDIVLFGEYAGSKLPALGYGYMVLREEEIYGILSK